MKRALIHIGSLGPLGHLPASGTVTVALLGVPLFAVMHPLPPLLYVVATLVFAGLAVGVHHLGDSILACKDSPILVWDELVGFLFAVAFVPFTWQLALLAFLLERTIDILKIPPANWVEAHVPGGWGVVGDDVIAGIYTCGIVHLVAYTVPAWVGLTG